LKIYERILQFLSLLSHFSLNALLFIVIIIIIFLIKFVLFLFLDLQADDACTNLCLKQEHATQGESVHNSNDIVQQAAE